MIRALDDYNWAEVFGEGSECSAIIPDRPPGSDVSVLTFGREDVQIILGMREGEREDRNWMIYGRLRDGRFFFAQGGCGYTGWEIGGNNSGAVAATLEDIIRFGLNEEARLAFNLQLAEDIAPKDVRCPKCNHQFTV